MTRHLESARFVGQAVDGNLIVDRKRQTGLLLDELQHLDPQEEIVSPFGEMWTGEHHKYELSYVMNGRAKLVAP